MSIMPFSFRVFASVQPVSLMKLTEIDDPEELLKKFDKNNILVEGKLDGNKVQAIKDGNKVHLFSRRGEEITDNFPVIVKALTNLPNGTLVEGEVVYEHNNKQDVGVVTSLSNSSAEKAIEKAKSLPGKIRLYLYDILWHKDKNVTEKAFSERRKLLESTIKSSDTVLLTKQYPFSDWKKVMKEAIESGGEGVVFKLKDTKYHWKPEGESEPKPVNTMFKFKKGGGKSESDDYVVYNIKEGPKGSLLAQFGQYYKGKLYAISEIDNFSAENEAEVKKHLAKGSFVIEIGFQERVPKGLRHQKFLRFRDDKKPKDATMDEFHIKHIGEFELAKMERKAMFALAATIPSIIDLVTTLEQTIKPTTSVKMGPTRIGNIGNVDGDKMFRIMSKLESNGRTDTVGDSGTSFGPTQIQGPYLLLGLSKMPGAQVATGLSQDEMRQLSSEWILALNKLKGIRLWKYFPIDQEEAKRLPQVKRMEQTFIRRPDMIIEKRGNQFVGKTIDTEAMNNLGFDVNSEVFNRTLTRIYTTYVTDSVARSVLAQGYLSQVAPLAFQKFKRQFNSTSIRKNKPLSNLLEQASVADFSRRISAVSDAVTKSGYDTTISGAFNIYQLIIIANASGVGRVQQFLLNKKPFDRGNLHYIQSSRFIQTLNALKKTDPELSEIINDLLVGIPPNNGLAGFQSFCLDSLAKPLSRKEAIMLLAADESLPTTRVRTQAELAPEQARRMVTVIERWLNHDFINLHDRRDAGLIHIRIDRKEHPPKLILWTTGDVDVLKRLVPKHMWGMPIVFHAVEKPKESEVLTEFEDEVTPVDIEARMLPKLFVEYRELLKEKRTDLKLMRKQMPEDELRILTFFQAAKNLGYTREQIKKMIGEFHWLRFSWQMPLISKYATNRGVLAFPGHYAEDIKSGKMERTIRPADMPVEVDEVVTAITYSGSIICRIKILSKETMSLPRLEKSFGKHVARSLEHRFGPDRRFVVIRFTRFDVNEADDGTLDEEKRDEVLIEKDGVKLTRGQIYDHYAKPIIRKQIMSRIKGKPVLIYLGIGKNEKILKRNHDDKPIVISDDDQSNSEKSNNYWYWAKRRLLSIHQVFETKTNIGFIDLDLHGGYPLEKAKEYAKKLNPIIKEKYGVQPKIYQSGGTGLHIEFELDEKTSIDNLRKELREMLDKINEDFEGATTGIVKTKGMRTDVSTLHNKGSLRVPGSLGEIWGKVKKLLSQNTDDYGNNNFGGKDSDTGPFGESGAITPMPYHSVAPGQLGTWFASERCKLFRIAGDK